MDEYTDSFSHGPVVSKLWLCEELEKALATLMYNEPTVNILGCWVNVLGFMLQVRKPNYYKQINSYDVDSESIRLSDKLCDAWKFENSRIYNILGDIRKIDFNSSPESIFISCSVDQIEGTEWYDKIPKGTLVCLQTTTLPTKTLLWKITQETKSVSHLLEKYPLSNVLYTGEKHIQYATFGYTRLMSIGIK